MRDPLKNNMKLIINERKIIVQFEIFKSFQWVDDF